MYEHIFVCPIMAVGMLWVHVPTLMLYAVRFIVQQLSRIYKQDPNNFMDIA
jgi:hypothetical protein